MIGTRARRLRSSGRTVVEVETRRSSSSGPRVDEEEVRPAQEGVTACCSRGVAQGGPDWTGSVRALDLSRSRRLAVPQKALRPRTCGRRAVRRGGGGELRLARFARRRQRKVTHRLAVRHAHARRPCRHRAVLVAVARAGGRALIVAAEAVEERGARGRTLAGLALLGLALGHLRAVEGRRQRVSTLSVSLAGGRADEVRRGRGGEGRVAGRSARQAAGWALLVLSSGRCR